jgi:hypothetical protein
VSFVSQAVAAGAGVILWQPTSGVSAPSVPAHVDVIAVPEL